MEIMAHYSIYKIKYVETVGMEEIIMRIKKYVKVAIVQGLVFLG
jgi:hypothetical protein